MKWFSQKTKPPKESPGNDEQSYSFAQKVGRFFSAEPQKEKVLQHEDFQAAGDVYYANISASYKVIQRILWLFFVFFMVITIITNYNSITYDNFFYLIKDFSGAVDHGNVKYETLSYESDSRQNFVLYRGGLATVSPSKLSIFTATGRRTLNTTSGFSSPYAVSSNKYVLIYDSSGTTFSVYNAFARVYTETLDYPVTNACLAQDGSFIIVTRSADSKSLIYFYNKNFHRIAEIRADYYIFDIEMDTDRNLTTLLSYDIGDGTGRSTLSVYDTSRMVKQKELTKIHSISLEGEFPISCGFLDNNTFAVITNRCVRIFDSDFTQQEISTDYSEGNITGYHLTGEGVAVAVSLSSKNLVVAFDKYGNLLYNNSVSYTVSDLAVFGNYLFLQTEQDVTKVNCKNEVEQRLESGRGKLLIYNEKTVLVCGESKAEYLIFD